MNKRYFDLIDETLYSFVCENGLNVFLLNKSSYNKTYGILATKFGSCDNEFMVNDVKYSVIDGAAHFLEHKMFEKTNYDVMDIFNKQQASCNAFTSFDKTAYLFNATDNIELNVNTLLDFVYNIELSDESVNKEKPIIGSEIKMYEDDVDWQSFFLSLQSMYHNNTVKIDIAGSIESIYNIKKEDLELYHKYFYHPSNMVLFICGGFDLTSITNCIKDNQSNYNFEDINLVKQEIEEPREIVHKYMEKIMEVSNTKYTYSFKVNEYVLSHSQQDIGMSILIDLLFSKKTSFYQDLLNDKKINYNYYVSYTQDVNHNYSFIQFMFNTEDQEYLDKYLNNFFSADLSNLIIEEEFETVKAKYLGDYIRLFNNPESISNAFISYYFSNSNLFEIIDVINTLDIDSIKKLLKLFNLDYQTTTVIKKVV